MKLLAELSKISEDRNVILNESKKEIVERIVGETMSALVKLKVKPSPEAYTALRNGIKDAYDDGFDAGAQESQQ